MKKIYLDHSATTPVDKNVLKAMWPYYNKKYGNPSSIHNFGQVAMAGIDTSREIIANHLNCSPSEIIFTSGATESNNLALFGIIKSLKNNGYNNPHIIASKIEHEAVLEPLKQLAREGVEVSYANVDKKGVVDVEKLKKLIKDNTVLISVMYVNSEIGSIQPIRQIGKIIKKINENRQKNYLNKKPSDRKIKPYPIYFHTDATQALNFLKCDVSWDYIDLLSISGHKIYGPKGVGCLYKKENVPILGIQLGGHHENNLRSGTLNTVAIVGLGEAIKSLNLKNQKKYNKKILYLRNYLVNGIIKNIPRVILNTDLYNSSPAHAHFSFLGAEGEAILIALDIEGIAVSTGSACASGSLKPSYVLLAMGIKEEISHSSIRFTLGKYNTLEEIKKVIKILPPIIKKLRKMSPEI